MISIFYYFTIHSGYFFSVGKCHASIIIAGQFNMAHLVNITYKQSHTAIVAREFKIPCIVKTNIGTKVVKDGDELEVDASNGVVKILS